MPVDANIALQTPQLKLDNPMDVATKALTLKTLGQQSQVQDQAYQDDQNLRSAFKQNANADGSINKQGVLSSLAQSGNGKQVLDYTKLFQNQDLDKLKAQSEIGKNLAWSVRDQDSLATAKQQAIKMGLPNADKIPDDFNDPAAQKFVKDWQVHSLDGDKQLQNHIEEQKLGYEGQRVGIENKKANAEIDRNKIARETNATNKENTNLNQVQSLLESARGNPEVGQALKDVYAAKKLKSLLGNDPNNLNPQMAQLAAMEVAKIGTGGVPTSHELQGLNPSTLPKGLAELAQLISNDPHSARMGEFLKLYQDYANKIAGDANDVVKEKWGRVIESRKDSIGAKNYDTLKKQYMAPFDEAMQRGGGGQKPFEHMSDAEVDQAYKAAGGQ